MPRWEPRRQSYSAPRDTGTGKTTYLSRQVERAAERYGPDRVVVASLTRTAAAEIAGRGLPIPPENVGTLHALCYRALGRPKLVYPTIAEFNAEHRYNLTPPSGGTNADDLTYESMGGATEADEMMAHLDLLRARMIPRELWPAHVRTLADRWETWKALTGTVDFTDMIEHALQRFDRAPGGPDVIVIDESQDLDKLEIATVSQWSRRAQHTVIAGDDDQCAPEGSLVLTAGHGDVPIEKLDPAVHRLVGFAIPMGCMVGREIPLYTGADGMGLPFVRASREYAGDLVVVDCGGRETATTPDHTWLVVDREGWTVSRVKALDLRAGMLIPVTQGGQSGLGDSITTCYAKRVKEIRFARLYTPCRVHSLSVDVARTYVQDGIVTHNCLYGWRGASVEDFLGFSERKIVLSRSYRLPHAVKDVADRWAAGISVREPKKYSARNSSGSVVVADHVSLSEPAVVVEELDRRVRAGLDVMALATCGYMLAELLDELRARALPFHNPYRVKRGDWNPLRRGGRSRVTAVDRVLALVRPLPEVAGGTGAPWTWADLYRWAGALASNGVLVRGAKRRLQEMRGCPDVVPEADLRLLVLEHALDRARAGDLGWYRANLVGSKAGPMDFPLRVAERRGAAALRERPRLVVGTCHSTKGAETDCTFLFPDISPSAADEAETRAGLDSVMRTFYVGMTRARHELVLCDARSRLAVEWPAVPRADGLGLDRVAAAAAEERGWKEEGVEPPPF